MDIVKSTYDPAAEELAGHAADNASDSDQVLDAGDAAFIQDDTRTPGGEYSTDVYADLMRSVPLLSRAEEETLGKTVFDSRVAMTRALSKIPAASVVLVARFREVGRGDRPRTDVFFAPFEKRSEARENNPASAQEETLGSDAEVAESASRGSRSVWQRRGQILAARLEDWRSSRNASRAVKRLSKAFLELEPGLVVLRDALERCRVLDQRVASIENQHGLFHADLLDAEGPESTRTRPSALDDSVSTHRTLRAVENEAGVDLTTLRACVRAAASAHADYRSARARMVSANLKLAHYLAYRIAGNGVDVEDLVQEAMIGLMRAVDRFDYRLGYKFSTYAFHWIRQTTMLAVAESSRTVRVTPHMHERIRRLRKIAGALEQRFGRIPTPAELIEESGLTAAQVGIAREASMAPMSFDAPLSNLDDSNLHALVEDPAQTDPSESAADAQRSRLVAELLDTLPPREAFILRLRHGIGVCAPHTLEEIGARLGITRERIRQLEALAMAKLRQRLSPEQCESN